MAITVQYGDYTLPLVLSQPGYVFGTTPDHRKTFRCVFRVTGDPINTAVTTAYTKCQLKNKDLRVQVDGNDIEYFQQAQGEALLGKASIQKTGDRFDTEVARHFIFNWIAESPAGDVTGETDGLLESRVTVNTDTAGRRVTQHEGKYTNVGATSALTKFEDGTTGAKAVAAAWHTANLGAFGQAYRGFELVTPGTVRYDDQTQTAVYTLLYRERMIPDPDGGGGLTGDEAGNTDLTVEDVSVTKLTSGWHGFSESAGDRGARAVQYQVTFSCMIDTSRAYSEFGAIYEATKGSLLAYLTNSGLATGANPGNLAEPILLSESAKPGLANHSLIVTWILLAAGHGDYTLYNNKVTRRNDHRNLVRDLADGIGESVIHSPGLVQFAIQEIDAERIGEKPALDHLTPLFAGGTSGWLLLEETPREEEVFAYNTTGGEVTAHRASVNRSYRWINSSGAVFTEGPPQ